VPLLLGTDFDGVGHICQKTNLHRRLRGVLPANRSDIRRQRRRGPPVRSQDDL